MKALKLITYFIPIVIFCFLIAEPTIAKEFVSKKTWENKSSNYDYTENFKSSSFENSTQKQPQQNIEHQTFANVLVWGKYGVYGIVITIVIILLAIVIIRIVRESRKNLKITSLDIRIQDIENIEQADLDTLLNDTLKVDDYKAAIRVRYLQLLQLLHLKKLILWTKDKTNGNYIHEMYDNKNFETFRQLTLYFDRVWYGELLVDSSMYYSVIPLFEKIEAEVRSYE